MISRINLAFTSVVHAALACTSVASCPPSNVPGHCALATTSTRFVGRWCEGFVLVTSWKPVVSARRPDPWQLGQVVVNPNEFAMRRSPPQTPQDSSGPPPELVPRQPDVGSLIACTLRESQAGRRLLLGEHHSAPSGGETILSEDMPRALVRDSIRAVDGYVPGEQPDPGVRVVKLNTNENPYPPSPRVLEAIQAMEPRSLQRYPPPMADPFRAAAAKVLGIGEDWILAGNGSDDILTIATRTFLAPGDTLAYPEPTYSLYPVLARLQDARVAAVPWEPD